MDDAKNMFAQQLAAAKEAAGYAPRTTVLEQEFNTQYWGKPMTLHGVRRWLLGDTLPPQDQLLVMDEWLGVQSQDLRFGAELPRRVEQRRAQWELGVGYEEREVFEAFLRLPVPQRRVVREVILAFARAEALRDDKGR